MRFSRLPKRADDLPSSQLSAIKASGEMAKLTLNIDSAEARLLALEHHALYIGIGNEFMDSVVPLIQSMKSDLMETESMTDTEAGVLRSLYLGKVFKCLIEAGKV